MAGLLSVGPYGYRTLTEHNPDKNKGKQCPMLDPASGVKRTLGVMIAVLGFSRYLCARVVWRNDVATTLAAIESIWQELGGVASRLTSDNPKCFALTACRYEPVLNPAFERFATHYGFTIECLPPRDPQKKGKIERMVRYVRRLYEAHGEFISLDESQQYTNSPSPINVVMARLNASHSMI